jgi:hypothetical protein
MNTAQQAQKNMDFVRGLLGEKQPGFARSVELAASVVAGKLREPGQLRRTVSVENT